jgi:hypothetical protein
VTGAVTSFCRMCGACCGVRVTVEDGGALRVAGDRDHPVSRGYACPKSRRMIGMIDDPAVLGEPMMRDSRGKLVPASARHSRSRATPVLSAFPARGTSRSGKPRKVMNDAITMFCAGRLAAQAV